MSTYSIECVQCGAQLGGKTMAEFRAAMDAHVEQHEARCDCAHDLADHGVWFGCLHCDCIVHDQSYTRVCTGCAADEKAAS